MSSTYAFALASSFLIDASPVVWPIAAILAAALLFFRSLRKHSEQLDVFEVGVFYAVLVILYTLFPFVSYLSGDLSFSPLSDNRLFQAQPSPRELAPIFWYYFLYFGAFGYFYARYRGAYARRELTVQMPPRRTLSALVISLLVIKGFFICVKMIYGLQDSETYEESYLMYQGLPRLLQQILGHLGGITFTLQILIMSLLVLNFRKYKYWICGWILLEFLFVFFGGVGSRTGLLVLLISVMASYHFTVKRFRVRTALAMGLGALLLFVSLGLIRGLRDISAGTLANPLSYANEFEILFANAYDVSQLKATGETQTVFPQFYFADFLNLVPQQLLPIKKMDTAAWYVGTFYPAFAQSGGGLAFGAVSEAILGLGWVDALWRGAIIGFIFAWLHRRFVRRRHTLWSYGLYLWVLIFAYQCFRGTTFALVPRVFYQFALVFILIPIFAEFLALFDSGKISSVKHLAPGANDSITSPGTST